jgi:phosphatidylglycerol:prolipoprotein diacylglycerol transferase
MVTLGIILAMLITIYIGKKYNIKSSLIIDLSFVTIIGGLLGARIYEVLFVDPLYYFSNFLAIFKIWEGGLAIYGGMIGGGVALVIFIKKHFSGSWSEFYKFIAIIVPGLALGQAIGRWGNYFNQEIFGLPTKLPWGIPINLENRPELYLNNSFFHPAFLYESLGNLVIFFILFFLHDIIKKKGLNKPFLIISLSYFFLYSALRFLLEFIRLDETLLINGWRLSQIISLVITIISFLFLLKIFIKKQHVKE